MVSYSKKRPQLNILFCHCMYVKVNIFLLPNDNNSKVENSHENPVSRLHPREGSLGDYHANQNKDECVCQIPEHAPEPTVKNIHVHVYTWVL